MTTPTVSELESLCESMARRGEESSQRIQCLLDLSELVVIDNPQRAVDLARDALDLAHRLDDSCSVAISLAYLGWAESNLSDFDSALEHLHAAKTLLEEQDESGSRIYGRVLMALSGVHWSLGNVERAYEVSLEALRIFRTEGDLINEAWMLYGLATGNTGSGDLDRALEDFSQALRLFAEAERTLGDRRSALGRARALNGIGGVYHRRGRHDLALMYHRDSLRIFREHDTVLGTARALDDLGTTYQQLGEFDCACDCHTESLRLREQVGNRQAQCTSLINLGRLYTRTGAFDQAVAVLQRALSMAERVKSRPREYQAHEALSVVYQKQGNLGEAFVHHEHYHRIHDAVVGEQTNARVRNLQIAYAVESAEKQAEIERLHNVELKDKNEQLERLLNELTETQVQLIQSEKMASLGQLVSTLVHELNTPLGTIDSTLDLSNRAIANIESLVESADSVGDLRSNTRFSKSLSAIKQNREIAGTALDRIIRLVRSLRSFSRLDQATTQYVDVRQGIEDTLTLLQPELGDRIALHSEFGDCPPITGNPGELNQVFMNLISNAVHAIDAQGTITIRTFAHDGHVHIEIADSGVGIPAEQVRQLFDPGFSRRGSRIKAGLGLFTSYNIVQKHGGEIRVDTEIGKGSRFTVVLPAGRQPI